MKIAVIGSGNVATFFSHKLYEAGHRITQVLSKNAEHASRLASQFKAEYETNPDHLHAYSDIYLLAVNDDALPDYLDHPILKNKIVIYSSGAIGLTELSGLSLQLACIWPVYSIQKENLPKHDHVPLVINHTKDVDANVIEQIASAISKSQYKLSDEQKKTVHLGAVIANNFTNHLYTLSNQLLEQQQIPFDLLLPIIQNTTEKLQHSSPEKNQSGPAIRHDKITIGHHLEQLRHDELLKKIYTSLTESIQKYYR